MNLTDEHFYWLQIVRWIKQSSKNWSKLLLFRYRWNFTEFCHLFLVCRISLWVSSKISLGSFSGIFLRNPMHFLLLICLESIYKYLKILPTNSFWDSHKIVPGVPLVFLAGILASFLDHSITSAGFQTIFGRIPAEFPTGIPPKVHSGNSPGILSGIPARSLFWESLRIPSESPLGVSSGNPLGVLSGSHQGVS